MTGRLERGHDCGRQPNRDQQKEAADIVPDESGGDDALRLVPPKQMSLEQCLEFLGDDELLEVTPQHLRLRKRILSNDLRMKTTHKKK